MKNLIKPFKRILGIILLITALLIMVPAAAIVFIIKGSTAAGKCIEHILDYPEKLLDS